MQYQCQKHFSVLSSRHVSHAVAKRGTILIFFPVKRTFGSQLLLHCISFSPVTEKVTFHDSRAIQMLSIENTKMFMHRMSKTFCFPHAMFPAWLNEELFCFREKDIGSQPACKHLLASIKSYKQNYTQRRTGIYIGKM